MWLTFGQGRRRASCTSLCTLLCWSLWLLPHVGQGRKAQVGMLITGFLFSLMAEQFFIKCAPRAKQVKLISAYLRSKCSLCIIQSGHRRARRQHCYITFLFVPKAVLPWRGGSCRESSEDLKLSGCLRVDCGPKMALL